MNKDNTTKAKRIHKLTDEQQSQAMRIFSHAISESSYHIRKIRITGRNLFTRSGIEVTLSKAIGRRRHCMKIFRQVFRGFMEGGNA